MGKGKFINQKLAKRTGHAQVQQKSKIKATKGAKSRASRQGRDIIEQFKQSLAGDP